jgi:SUMO ligase MMS21 Smc5/6 complex component
VQQDQRVQVQAAQDEKRELHFHSSTFHITYPITARQIAKPIISPTKLQTMRGGLSYSSSL